MSSSSASIAAGCCAAVPVASTGTSAAPPGVGPGVGLAAAVTAVRRAWLRTRLAVRVEPPVHRACAVIVVRIVVPFVILGTAAQTDRRPPPTKRVWINYGYPGETRRIKWEIDGF